MQGHPPNHEPQIILSSHRLAPSKGVSMLRISHSKQTINVLIEI